MQARLKLITSDLPGSISRVGHILLLAAWIGEEGWLSARRIRNHRLQDCWRLKHEPEYVVIVLTDTVDKTNPLLDIVRSLENLGSDVQWVGFRTFLLLAPGPIELEPDIWNIDARTSMPYAPPVNPLLTAILTRSRTHTTALTCFVQALKKQTW